MSLDYADLFRFDTGRAYRSAAESLELELPSLWLAAYQTMCSHEPNVMQFETEGFQHLFDFMSDPTIQSSTDLGEDRLVAVFGYSLAPTAPRDASRMRGFLGRRLTNDDGDLLDKGHFMAHSLGGGTDVNLFPQRPELNRGWSDPGKVFRKMERYAASQPGTFVFARPIYGDASWAPTALEYGLLRPDVTLWVERFAN